MCIFGLMKISTVHFFKLFHSCRVFFFVIMNFDRDVIPLLSILLLTHECSRNCLSMFICHRQINNLSVFAPGLDSPVFVVDLLLTVVPQRW